MRSSLATLGAVIVVALVFFLTWPGLATVALLIGLFAAGLLLTSMLKGHPEPSIRKSEKLTAQEFRKAVNLGAFLDKSLRDRVAEAIRVWQDCETMVENAEGSGLVSYFADRTTTVRESVLTIYELATHLNSYRRSRLSAEELTRLAEEVQVLRDSVGSAPTPDLREQMERNLESKFILLASQRSLAATMARASWQLDGTLALLKALSAQMRAALVTGDGYVDGVQQVVDDLRREVRDLQQTGQIIGGLDVPTSLSSVVPPTRSGAGIGDMGEEREDSTAGSPGVDTSRPSLPDGRLGRLMRTLGSAATRRPSARNRQNKP